MVHHYCIRRYKKLLYKELNFSSLQERKNKDAMLLLIFIVENDSYLCASCRSF